jgi:hypothetical protein
MLKSPFAQSLLLLGLVAAAACSSSSDDDSDKNGIATGATGNGVGGSGNAAATSGGSGIIDLYGGNNTGASSTTGGLTATGGYMSTATACPGLAYDPNVGTAGGGGACAGSEQEVEASKLDIYIMMDRTQSMDYLTQCDANDVCASTRWQDLRAAVAAFVVDPTVLARDVRAGIQFFSKTGEFDNPLDCDPNVYATPAVEIAPLAESGPQIMAAIDATFPSGETPSVPALQGAIQHAADWQAANPIRQTIVLLVTDGIPTMCDRTDTAFTAAAAAGMTFDHPIRTYIVGVGVGANRFTLDSVARFGGSTEAFLVDDANSRQALVDALQRVTAQPLPCEYTIPADPDPLHVIDYGKVQVLHTPAAGPQEEVPYAVRRGGCSNFSGGWYYDLVPSTDPTAAKPSRIIMCPCTCASLNVGTLEILYGCRPQTSGVG